MTAVSFTLRCVPTAQQRPRHTRTPGGFDRTYKSKTQTARERELDLLLMPHKPPQPLDGAICLAFTAFMPIPKAAPKREKMAMAAGRMPHTKKPDLDNLAKQLKDAMTRCGFWHDDRQVVKLTCAKQYAEIPGWSVEIKADQQGAKGTLQGGPGPRPGNWAQVSAATKILKVWQNGRVKI